MRFADGLRPDLGTLELQDPGCRQDAGFDVRADPDHGTVKFVDRKLAQRLFLGGVGPDHVREAPVVGLDNVCAGVDAKHFDDDDR